MACLLSGGKYTDPIKNLNSLMYTLHHTASTAEEKRVSDFDSLIPTPSPLFSVLSFAIQCHFFHNFTRNKVIRMSDL